MMNERNVGIVKENWWKERMNYFIIKHHFLTMNRLPMDFDFVSYLDKSFVVWIVETMFVNRSTAVSDLEIGGGVHVKANAN